MSRVGQLGVAAAGLLLLAAGAPGVAGYKSFTELLPGYMAWEFCNGAALVGAPAYLQRPSASQPYQAMASRVLSKQARNCLALRSAWPHTGLFISNLPYSTIWNNEGCASMADCYSQSLFNSGSGGGQLAVNNATHSTNATLDGITVQAISTGPTLGCQLQFGNQVGS